MEYKPLNGKENLDVEKGYVKPGVPSDIINHGTPGAAYGYVGWYVDDETRLRNQFLGKTFLALFLELLVTALIALLPSIINPEQNLNFVVNNIWIFWTAIAVFFVSLIMLFCFRQKKPFNFILLGLFVISTGCMLGVVCLTYALPTVLLAFGVTTLIAGNLGMYAWVSKKDFTWMGGGLIIALTIMIVWSIFGGLFWNVFFIGWMQPVFAILGCIIFSCFILYDVSRIRQTMDYDQWLLASLSLYLDTINLFMFVLQLLGGRAGR